MNELNEKQLLFCEAYARSGNGTLSAKESGYSEGRAKQTAYELLQNPLIVAEIKRLEGIQRERIRRRINQVADQVVDRLVEIALDRNEGANTQHIVTACKDLLNRYELNTTNAERNEDDDQATEELLRAKLLSTLTQSKTTRTMADDVKGPNDERTIILDGAPTNPTKGETDSTT